MHKPSAGITLRLLVLVCLVSAISRSSLGQQQRPNIVLILSDDQAWGDYGFMGHDIIQTPQLDALAAQSLVFPRGYVTSPLCRPSLASMMTGLYPHDHGVTGNDVDGRNNRFQLDIPVQERFHQLPNLAKSLVANGYLAHQSGKWWEGSFADGGFTHGMTHGDPARGGRHGDEGLTIGRKGIQPIEQFVDLAMEQEKPFFIYYAPFLPHTPHNPPSRLLEKYTAPGREMDVAKYFAMCEWFDETCGELLNLIDNRGLRENTVILYICDNGWAAASTNAADPNQKHWGHFALRSKGSPNENGIRTPIMVRWPGKVKPGSSLDFASAIDLYPTACAAVGIDQPVGLPGINLMDQEASGARKAMFGVTHAIHNMVPGQPDATLQYLWVIEGDYKLIMRYAGENKTDYAKVHDWDTTPFQLHDLANDPHEKHNLASEHPEIVDRLRAKIEAWHPVSEEFHFKG